MAHKHLSYYLDNLSRLEEITVEELQNWQNEYPYVQNLKFLIAKKQQQISNNPDKESLQIASVYSADRSFLYKQLAPKAKETLPNINLKEARAPKSPKAATQGVASITTGVTAIATEAVVDKKKKKVKKLTEVDRNEKVAKIKSKIKASNAKVKAKVATKAKSKSNRNATIKTHAKKVTAKKKPLNLKYDNLKKIEGIGPKIEKLLYASNIRTYKQLAASSENRLIKALAKGGSRYKSHNPTTWPKQAQLAAAEKWNQLKKLQDKIERGKIKTAKKATSKKTAKLKTPTTKKPNKPTIKRVKKITVTPAAKKKGKKKTTVHKRNVRPKAAPKKKTSAKAKTRAANKAKSNAKKATPSNNAKAKKAVAKKVASAKSTAKKAVTKKSNALKSTVKSKAKVKSLSTKQAKTKKKNGNTKTAVGTSAINNKSSTKSKRTNSKSQGLSKNKENSVSSFSQWLMSMRSEEKKQKKTSTKLKKANKPKKANSKTDRKIKASIKNKDKVVSESLAKLLAKQGHHTKARNMYKKLSLLFPPKSTYFAAQIEKLKSNK